MQFLKAGFNTRFKRLGVFACTRKIDGKRYEPVEMIQFAAGDYAWLGRHRNGDSFIAWGESCVFGSWDGIKVPEWAVALELSRLPDSGLPPRKVSVVLIGEPASKSNSRQLVMRGRGKGARAMFIKSEKGLEYEAATLLQIPPSARLRMECPVRVTLRIFYATERPDLDESLILDILQDRYWKDKENDVRVLIQSGVYRNDRQVREKHVFWGLDKANPRAEIEVEPLVWQSSILAARAAA